MLERGVDCESGILSRRSWRWLSTHIVGLLTTDSRLARALEYALPLGHAVIRTQ